VTVYVASSWRNARYPEVVARLRAEGIEHYDFRNPEDGNHGFSGAQVSRELGYGEDGWKNPQADAALLMLFHPLADEGFRLDHGALLRASAGLLVMPCGRSAHLELGYLAGRGKPTVVLLDDGSEIDLMWRLADCITYSLDEAVAFVRDAGEAIGDAPSTSSPQRSKPQSAPAPTSSEAPR
jgi:hypothetical protein